MILLFGLLSGCFVYACAECYPDPLFQSLSAFIPKVSKKLTVFLITLFLSEGIVLYLCSVYHGIQLLGLLIMSFALLYASLTDVKTGLIPDRTHVLILAGICCLQIPSFQNFLFAICTFVLGTFIAEKTQALGLGDVKLLAVLSLILHADQLIQCLCIASCSALVIISPLLFNKTITKETEIPFGPFLSLGAWLCLLF